MSSSGAGFVYSAFRATVADTAKPCVRIIIDRNRPLNAIDIEVFSPLPEYNAPISWDQHHAYLGDRKVKRLGYWFDPDAPLH